MRIIPAPPAEASAGEAAAELLRGGLIAFRTDTLYGLSALPGTPGFARLVELKRREGKPFLSLAADASRALAAGAAPGPLALRLAAVLWPGPVTLLLAAGEGVDPALRGPDGSFAVRVPADPWCLRLLARLGAPLPSTSANLPGEPACRSAGEIAERLGDSVDLLVDGGAAPAAVPSALVDARGTEPTVLRPGPPGTPERIRAAARGA